ncbi:sensor histidine kinase [Phytohabitans flavus]|uniref:sensor histidine kinase n=1 Tax=Phytohabitans flavus TaxID=1076124 RepID=UPI0036354322
MASLVANLVDNAVRHNTPGGRIEVTTATTGAGGLVRVWNTGPVVPAGEVERLLQPFQRAGRDRVADSHGLGLAIVRAIARAHGAALNVTARPEGGLDIEVAFGCGTGGPNSR